MTRRAHGEPRGRGWWAAGLLAVIAAVVAATALTFSGSLVSSVPVMVSSDRSGLVMESGGKVKLRGIVVGHVEAVHREAGLSTLALALDSSDIDHIPANVQAQIKASTVFGAKYVELVEPEHPTDRRITAGSVIVSRNVTTEVNTLFDNLTLLVQQVDPPKLNAVLTAVADSLRGKGERLGQATTAAGNVLTTLNARMPALNRDFRSLAGGSDTYSAAAQNIIATLKSFSTTSRTLTRQAADLDEILLNTTGLARAGTELLEPNMENLIAGVNGLQPTTDLLYKYNPEYTCTLQGAHWALTDGGLVETAGGSDNRSSILDVGISFASDPYKFPENLPIIGARGGPDGRPSCGGLPRPDLDLPVRDLVTNTGYGTGLDLRPNPGPAHPFLTNFFPVTKAVPEPPRIYGEGPPAIGPVPYPGAPPYGAPLFGPDGAPLWAPPPPGAPPPPVPGVPNPPPPYGSGQPVAAPPSPAPAVDQPDAPASPPSENQP